MNYRINPTNVDQQAIKALQSIMSSQNNQEIVSNSIHPHPNRQLLLKLSFAFWLISLALPALITPNSEHTSFGVGILGMGWLGIAGVEDGVNLLGVLAWWANPVYLWAIAKALSNKTQPIFSAYLATGLGALTFLLSSYAINAVPHPLHQLLVMALVHYFGFSLY